METTTIEAPNLEQTVTRMKSEILADMASGKVPETCGSFSELHDYVDANCYGGFCEDDYLAKVWGFSGFLSDDDCPDEINSKVTDFFNAAQNAVHAWLHEISTTRAEIEKLQEIQKTHRPTDAAWNTASELLAPLFARMSELTRVHNV